MTGSVPIRALFVGNSYTLGHDVPGQVEALAAEAGCPLRAETVARGGAHFGAHWGDAAEEPTGARARIEAGGVDVVVLQDQSGGPLHDRTRFERYGARLADSVQQVGARLVWFQTWARAEGHAAYAHGWSGGAPEAMTVELADAYRQAARTHGGLVAPVGEAWWRAISEHGLELHDEDLHHASAVGAHLAALVLGGAIAGLDPRLARWVPASVRTDEAETLRRVAASVLRERSAP